MKITFLGTGTSQGIPMIANNDPVCLSNDSKDKRLRSSVMISWNNVNYIIDCGPDFRQQMLRENVQSIRGVLFTHEHADHTAGIDDLRPYTYQMGEVPIYAQKRVLDNLKLRFSYIFQTENRYAGAPKLIENIVGSNSFLLDGVKVTPIEIMHGKLPITAYRLGEIAYITDLKTISFQEKKKLENLEILIVNALRIEQHPTHLNLEEALKFVKEINPKRAYFTHISHKLGFHANIQKRLPENIFLSYDGLQIKV
ncbi:MAG: Phosphoribosyl 1,2-cyclic phosphate phosphodiesterase [Flavobacterium sp. SCGC AAA160-P02]|nr:MAG: Phosphoribosyl 1,2-cyclic phosphate phosphodiesterase [Flavobacterium sp. SCGC AAA160-P02]